MQKLWMSFLMEAVGRRWTVSLIIFTLFFKAVWFSFVHERWGFMTEDLFLNEKTKHASTNVFAYTQFAVYLKWTEKVNQSHPKTRTWRQEVVFDFRTNSKKGFDPLQMVTTVVR